MAEEEVLFLVPFFRHLLVAELVGLGLALEGFGLFSLVLLQFFEDTFYFETLFLRFF